MPGTVKRPTRGNAESAIAAFLEAKLGAVPAFSMHEDGHPETDDPDKVGWAFWIMPGDTTSYVHNNLQIEWYGTSWNPSLDEA